MTLNKEQITLALAWFNVYENEVEPCSSEYKLMSELCLTIGNTIGAERYWRKHLSALDFERIAEAEWKAEESASENFT